MQPQITKSLISTNDPTNLTNIIREIRGRLVHICDFSGQIRGHSRTQCYPNVIVLQKKWTLTD